MSLSNITVPPKPHVFKDQASATQLCLTSDRVHRVVRWWQVYCKSGVRDWCVAGKRLLLFLATHHRVDWLTPCRSIHQLVQRRGSGGQITLVLQRDVQYRRYSCRCIRICTGNSSEEVLIQVVDGLEWSNGRVTRWCGFRKCSRWCEAAWKHVP